MRVHCRCSFRSRKLGHFDGKGLSDDLAKEGLDEVRVRAFLLGPEPPCCEHFALPVWGMNLDLASLEAACSADILPPLANGFNNGTIKPVDFRTDLRLGRAFVWAISSGILSGSGAKR